MEIVQAVKKLNSISREQLNFRRRPILCTTLYRNPMQASNFDGTFDHLFLWTFYVIFTQYAPLLFPWCKESQNDQKLKSRGVVQDPLEALLVIFGRKALIFLLLKALGKKWKITPLFCACAVVIILDTQKCRKKAPRFMEFNFLTNCNRQKRLL